MTKMRTLKMTPWNKLTLGEKILKVVTTLVKWALIVAVGLAAVAVVAGIAVAILAADAIIGAITGGLDIAANAYRPGDVYVRFR